MSTRANPPAEVPEMVIEAGRIEKQYWRDLWRYRELFCFLAWRDFLVRYKQTVVGVAWAVVRPLLMLSVLTFVFNGVAGVQAPEGVPYALMVLCGLLPWQFFATSFAESSNSLVANSAMVSKVYFPRIVVPASKLIIGLVDLSISAGLMVLLMLYYRFVPSLNALLLPVFLLMTITAALGAGLWISALMVRFRDFRFIVPFVVQLGFFLSPVGFSMSHKPEWMQNVCAINPMFGIIEGFRWSLIGGSFELSPLRLGMSAVTILLMVVTGLRYFRSTERTFADVI